jgi:predicted RNA-binding Zn-ribbon protein involved in translation (DUF1610 family)
MSDIKCPKCGSTQIHADKRGFKAGRAIAGTLIAGPLVGAASGAVGKNKITITCLACGNQFKPGEGSHLGGSSYSSSNSYPDGVTFVKQERANYKCSHCGKVSSFEETCYVEPLCASFTRKNGGKNSSKIASVKKSKQTLITT